MEHSGPAFGIDNHALEGNIPILCLGSEMVDVGSMLESTRADTAQAVFYRMHY